MSAHWPTRLLTGRRGPAPHPAATPPRRAARGRCVRARHRGRARPDRRRPASPRHLSRTDRRTRAHRPLPDEIHDVLVTHIHRDHYTFAVELRRDSGPRARRQHRRTLRHRRPGSPWPSAATTWKSSPPPGTPRDTSYSATRPAGCCSPATTCYPPSPPPSVSNWAPGNSRCTTSCTHRLCCARTTTSRCCPPTAPPAAAPVPGPGNYSPTTTAASTGYTAWSPISPRAPVTRWPGR